MSKILTTEPTLTKDIKLPSHGLYQSIIGTELDSAIENDCYELSDDISNKIYELLETDSFTKAQNKVNQRLIIEYGQFLINFINEEYSFNIKASNFEYVPMNMQNRGDTLHCNIDVNSLPSRADLSEFINNYDKVLQIAADERLSSHSGFISFYDTDITSLLDKPYMVWGDAHIMVLIELLLSESCNTIGDIEQNYLESINGCGGSMEYLFNALSDSDAKLLNGLLSPD